MERLSKDCFFYRKHYSTLKGKTVVGVVVDTEASADLGSPVVGLQFEDGTVAYVMRDAEGNGGGHLEIVK